MPAAKIRPVCLPVFAPIRLRQQAFRRHGEAFRLLRPIEKALVGTSDRSTVDRRSIYRLTLDNFRAIFDLLFLIS